MPRAQFGDESVINLGVGDLDVSKDVLVSLSNATLTKVPELQNGSLVVVPARPDSSFSNQLGFNSYGPTGSDKILAGETGGNPIGVPLQFIKTVLSGASQLDYKNYVSDVTSSGSSSALSIIALRRATALQRYKEIQECNDTDFCSQIEAHFGVRPNSHGSKSKFLGGYSAVFDINPQINQNLTGDNVANIQAAPTASGNGSCRFKVADDYGIVIGIYRITPQLDYADVGLDSRNLMVDAADYPIPELDSIGMDTLKINSLVVKDYPVNGNADLGGVNTSYAYAPRYLDFKLSFDRFSGAFLSSLRTWVTGQQMDMLQKAAMSAPLGGSVGTFLYNLLYCPPRLTANVFVNNAYDGIDNDQFMIGSFIGCSVKRKLSVYGLPYSN